MMDGTTVRRSAVAVAGLSLCVVGVALLVLPGPGLLLVLGGLVLLGGEFRWARRLMNPVRRSAMAVAEASVSSPLRIAGSVVAGVVLIAAGIAWLLIPSLPFGGAATGWGTMLGGLLLLGLLIYSAERFRRGRRKAGWVRPSHRRA